MVGDKPAYPMIDMNSHQGIDRLELRNEGMTLREYYAGLAMQGLISQLNTPNDFLELAHRSVIAADALLKALETKTE